MSTNPEKTVIFLSTDEVAERLAPCVSEFFSQKNPGIHIGPKISRQLAQNWLTLEDTDWSFYASVQVDQNSDFSPLKPPRIEDQGDKEIKMNSNFRTRAER